MAGTNGKGECNIQLIDGKIVYAPRVHPGLIIRLYRSDAQGLRDEELVDEVGSALYARCEDILAVSNPRLAKCPACGTFLPHDTGRKGTMRCGCGFVMPWSEYVLSYRNKDLMGSGALPVFERYIREYLAAKGYTEKMLAIDRMIHAFHFELQGRKSLCRPAATCVIHGFEAEIIRILNSLAYSEESSGGLREGYEDYREKLSRSSARKYV